MGSEEGVGTNAEDQDLVNRALTLDGLKVLDLGRRASSAWCSRLLADYGAEVIAVEGADGHPLRRDLPRDANGTSVAATCFLSGKQITGELDDEVLSALVGQADVLITDQPDGQRLSAAALAEPNPNAIICALTPFGSDGTRAQDPAAELCVSALSGWASVNGHSGREPLKSSGYQVAYQSGTFAFGCILAAVMELLASRANHDPATPGQIIDIAELEVLVSTFSPAPLRYQYSGFVWPRKQPLDVNDGPVPVADGYFALTISRPAFWIKAMRILGLPDLADDPELQQAGLRPKLKERFVERMGEAMSKWTRMDLFDALAAERVIAGPVLRMDELADNPQFLARGFFHRNSAGVRYPGPFARFGHSGWRVPEQSERLTDSGSSQRPQFESAAIPTVTPHRADSPGTGPLAGIRALVLTQAWAGTYATELLGLLGAEVIQLEVRKRLDSWRGTYQNPIPRFLQDVPTATHAWNLSPLYNSVNLNKQCITVDLDSEDGVALFRKLVASVDVVAENFSPRVMGKLGLDYDTLKGIKPDLVMASLSAYGAIGPWANVPGIGGTIEPSSGMSALLGYEGEEPLNSGQMYPDPAAGLCGFAAITLALLHRDRTGEGQFIDLSMQEANFTFVGDAWLEYELLDSVRGPQGNRHPSHAPHGIYPADGVDQWLAIAVTSDAQWRELVAALALPFDSELDESGRKQVEKQIDAALRACCETREKEALARELRARGIPAAAVHDAREVAEDLALQERGHMVQVVHPEAGTHWQSGLAAHFSRTPGGVTRAAPLQGQHSEAVFAALAGVTPEEYQRLADAEISGKGPVADSTVANQA